MKAKIIIAIAGIALLAACKANTDRRFDSSEADTVSATQNALSVNDPNTKEKLVKTADMNFKVHDVQKTGDSIASLTAKLGGLVMHHQMQSEKENGRDIRISADSVRQISVYNKTADMTVRIPSEKLEDFMNQVSRMSILTVTRKMDIEDKSLDYISARMKAQNRKEWVEGQDKLKATANNYDATLAVKDNIVNEKVNNLKTDANVKYSVVVLSFFQNKTITKEIVTNDDPSAYRPPFFNRLLMSLSNGLDMFSEFLLVIANLWVLVLVGIAGWIGFKAYRKKYAVLKV
ncbi:DUF4349 domain-containing protein [Mucilaginibacter conchicola]|nr:DUF4349 domain-containing protein [Mucilaginibacter conchicola]